MTLHKAKKVVIITEKLISKGVCKVAQECGATGFTIMAAGGKGSRNVRSTTEGASVVNEFANFKIEVIVNDIAMAEKIMDRVADEFFQNYSGITYTQDVEIVRPQKFITEAE